MNKKNKAELLEQVWENCTFDEIINAGFNLSKCGAIDLKVAASEFGDPREIDDDIFAEEIKTRGLHDVMSLIQNIFYVSDILDEFEDEDRLDGLSDDSILDHLDGTWALDEHDDKIRQNAYDEALEDLENDVNVKSDEFIDAIHDLSSNDLWCFFCRIFGIAYYDEEGLYNGFKKLITQLEKSHYKNRNDSKWKLIKE